MRALTTEADVQFELYRLLTDLILAQSFEVEFDHVEPERVTEGKAADLVIYVKNDIAETPAVVIEVKKPVDRSVLVFDDAAFQQTQGYVRSLGALLSILTDGNYLVAFGKTGNRLGVHRFSCNLDSCRQLLSGIASLLRREATVLPLETIEPPSELAVTEQLSVAQQAFSQLLEEVSKLSGGSMNEHGNVNDLIVRAHRVVALQVDPPNVWVVLWLNGLRNVLGSHYGSFIARLSDSPGFEWIKSRDLEGEYAARALTAVTAEDSDFNKIISGLRSWLFEVVRLASRME